jgi:16S rRNA (guanine(527)-N(7))-methyltransferase RsmG
MPDFRVNMKDIDKIVSFFSMYSGNNDNLNHIVRLHCQMLLKWQKIANLIGLSDERDIAEFLYLDSYFVIKLVSEYLNNQNIKIGEISDIGSGAGFPSIFWAHFMPFSKVILFEPKRKKANFLRDFIRIAEFKNYEVKEIMVKPESLQTELIISKAAININDWVRFGLSNLKRGGIVISLLTEDTKKIYIKSIENRGRIKQRDLLEYTLPFSYKIRSIGIVIKK